MADKQTTIDELKKLTKQFVQEREWEQFHSPKNLTASLLVEAGELMEHFLWMSDEASKEKLKQKRDAVESEIADVTIHILQLCWQNDVDLSAAIKRKLIVAAQKYPIEKAKGSNLKYTEL